MPWQLLADAVLALHVAVVLFVVGGLLLVLVGNVLGWAFVNRWWFRAAHALTIAVVVAEALLGIPCPLTTLEHGLRLRAGGSGYAQSFIGHWLQRFLFYDAPGWAFVLAYSAFGALVGWAWWRWPPR
jgi:hypothetical protein